MAANKRLTETVDRWWRSPSSMVRELFEVEPDPWQIDVLDCFPTQPQIALCACKGPGKTGTLSWLAWNFLLTRPEPNIAATSISGDNLHDNLWKECAKWRNRSKLLQGMFEITSERIFRKGAKDTHFMSARTWPKTGDSQSQADTLAGLHADYIMFILDESGGIPRSVMVAAEAALSSCIEGHILQAGNPTSLDGPLYDASRDRLENGGAWKVFEITGDPDDPKRSPRVSAEWAKDQIRKYGRDNPWVLVNVFGKFPPGSINSLISEDEVREAMKRYHRPHEIGDVAKVLGVDVARQGLDSSVICPRQGIQTFPLRRYRSVENGIVGASITNRIWDEFGADACFVDATGGMGFTWIDQLGVLGKEPIAVQFAGKASNDDQFVNKRAEMYWNAVQYIKRGGALPDIETEGARELMEALTKTTYFHKGDRIQIEEKDQIKDRLGFSPDEADAFVLTFAEPVSPKRSVRSPSHSAMRGAYNPMADIERGMRGAHNVAATNFDPFKSSY